MIMWLLPAVLPRSTLLLRFQSLAGQKVLISEEQSSAELIVILMDIHCLKTTPPHVVLPLISSHLASAEPKPVIRYGAEPPIYKQTGGIMSLEFMILQRRL